MQSMQGCRHWHIAIPFANLTIGKDGTVVLPPHVQLEQQCFPQHGGGFILFPASSSTKK